MAQCPLGLWACVAVETIQTNGGKSCQKRRKKTSVGGGCESPAQPNPRIRWCPSTRLGVWRLVNSNKLVVVCAGDRSGGVGSSWSQSTHHLVRPVQRKTRDSTWIMVDTVSWLSDSRRTHPLHMSPSNDFAGRGQTRSGTPGKNRAKGKKIATRASSVAWI